MIRPLTLLVVLVSLIMPTTSHGAFPGANGKIAFQSARDGNYEIYVMNADASSQTRLTNSNMAADQRPAWSPDGTKIVFQSSSAGSSSNPEIYTMNADGSSQTRLTNNTTSDTDPSWSPDGTKIAFATNRDDGYTYEIYTMNADGSSQTRLTNNTAGDTEPAWSPDGTKIAFHSVRQTIGGEIYVMNVDGTGETQITNFGDANPAWSPDGTKIAFDSCRVDDCHHSGSQNEIFVVNADGSNLTRLTTSPADDFEPAWSPDGTKIAFWTRRDGASEIYTMNADGTSQTRLTNNTDLDRSPDWQPVAVPGGYPRPKGATPLSVSLVPAYAQCTAPNRSHGPPLAFASCTPPIQASSHLTVGSPDANDVAANSIGYAKYSVIVGVPGGADDADVRLTLQLTDVRHRGTLVPYTGELQVASAVRITDRLGGPANEAATVTEFEHQLTVPCAATGDGATCSTTTTFDAVVPGTIKEGKRALWHLGQVRVNDGGPDGLASTTPNTLFAVQGVFVP